MTVLDVVDYLSDPKALARVGREVREEDLAGDDFFRFARDLSETMARKDGLGLAATQVAPGEEVPSVFAMMEGSTAIVVVNPRVEDPADSEWSRTGCLSFRSVPWMVRYPTRLRLVARTAAWEPVEIVLSGMAAKVVAHEVDHLQGKTMLDRMPRGERQKFLARVARAKR